MANPSDLLHGFFEAIVHREPNWELVNCPHPNDYKIIGQEYVSRTSYLPSVDCLFPPPNSPYGYKTAWYMATSVTCGRNKTPFYFPAVAGMGVETAWWLTLVKGMRKLTGVSPLVLRQEYLNNSAPARISMYWPVLLARDKTFRAQKLLERLEPARFVEITYRPDTTLGDYAKCSLENL